MPGLLPGEGDVFGSVTVLGDDVVRPRRRVPSASHQAAMRRFPDRLPRSRRALASIEGISVRPRKDTVIWEGEVGNASSDCRCLADGLAGPRRGLATVHIDGLRILRIDFVIRVVAVAVAAASRPLDVTEARLRESLCLVRQR